MRIFFKRLFAAGSTGAAILTYLTTSWGVLVSAALALLAWAWSSFSEWVNQPSVHAAGYVFIFGLWSYIGLLTLRDRLYPRLMRMQPDYRYGLTFEGLIPNVVVTREDQWLQFGFQLRNFSQNPIRYIVNQVDVRLGTRAMPKPEKIITGYLARGSGRISGGIFFKKDDVKEFFGKRVEGTAEAVIVYGHPEKKPERQLTVKINITIDFAVDGSPLITYGADIVDEDDKAFNNV